MNLYLIFINWKITISSMSSFYYSVDGYANRFINLKIIPSLSAVSLAGEADRKLLKEILKGAPRTVKARVIPQGIWLILQQLKHLFSSNVVYLVIKTVSDYCWLIF